MLPILWYISPKFNPVVGEDMYDSCAGANGDVDHGLRVVLLLKDSLVDFLYFKCNWVNENVAWFSLFSDWDHTFVQVFSPF